MSGGSVPALQTLSLSDTWPPLAYPGGGGTVVGREQRWGRQWHSAGAGGSMVSGPLVGQVSEWLRGCCQVSPSEVTLGSGAVC